MYLMSFNKAKAQLVDPLIAKGRLKDWTFDNYELVEFLNSDILESDIEEMGLDERSAEYYIAGLVIDKIVSPPRGRRVLKKKKREFVSPEQEQHFELYRTLNEQTVEFWKDNILYKQLLQLKRNITVKRKGGEVELNVAIEPIVYFRNAKAVIDSYEVA